MSNTNQSANNVSLADVATHMGVCRIFSLALPRFYERTGISAQFTFVYSAKDKAMEVSLGFSKKLTETQEDNTPILEPTQEEYSILFEEIMYAERLLTNEYVVNNSGNFENIKQLVFKHKEDTRQIVDKQKHVFKKQ